MNTAQSYDELASHYHLIFENWELSVERQAAALSSILQGKCGLATTARILDCACGIGTQSLGLAKMGFRVSGCDLSPRAIERARLEASRRNVDIHFSVANMLNLTSLGARLCPGGLLMASIRNYDRLMVERPATQGPSIYSDQGKRRIVFQVWDWVDARRYIFTFT